MGLTVSAFRVRLSRTDPERHSGRQPRHALRLRHLECRPVSRWLLRRRGTPGEVVLFLVSLSRPSCLVPRDWTVNGSDVLRRDSGTTIRVPESPMAATVGWVATPRRSLGHCSRWERCR